MSGQVYYVPGQTEERSKVFLEWTSKDLSSKLSLICEGNVNYHKSVHYPIPILPVGIGSTLLAIFKQISKLYFQPFNWVSRYILFLVKLKERGRPFLEGARMGTTLWDYPQKFLVPIRDEKVSPFVKFEIMLPALCFLLDPLTKKHIRR